jgi:hypothetical protein
MPLDTLITGRIAHVRGDDGFGWVEAIGIRDGRIAFRGSEVYWRRAPIPFTERIGSSLISRDPGPDRCHTCI